MKRILQLLVLLTIVALLLIQCNVIWLSPKKYKPQTQLKLEPPIMSLDEYTSTGLIDTHPRPFIYTIESKTGKGAVLVFGVEHTKDPNHKQFPFIKENWEKFNPTVAMVEGNLDLIMRPFFNPVKASGEGGYTQTLAKKGGTKLYSWEPGLEAEIHYVLGTCDPMHVATFYSLRPYNNKWKQFTKAEQDKKMNSNISERKNFPGLKGVLTSVEQVDSLWNTDFPGLESWRTYRHPRNGWPAGKLELISVKANEVRDVNLCNSIIELVKKGERVFVSMGSSHAVVIERTLKAMIK